MPDRPLQDGPQRMNVTVRQLKAFLAVAESGQFNRGAERLSLTQSATSVLVRNLETEVGLRLFSTTAISMVAAGLGIAVLPENTSQLAPRVQVAAVLLVDPVVSRAVSLLQHRHRSLSAAAEMMRAAILTAR